MTTAFYDRFERHAEGQGLKGHSTHYCPGCGHGLVHKFLADGLVELGLQDRTVLISPVGCSVFMYYYFDVGNTQAAHGRAPAVGLGHKLANPESIVVSYQGDGDLASIGLAEIVHAAQLGIPLTVIFVNNAVYGMTGGQLAPTTLMGQQTTTSPTGRNRLAGQPMRMAEMLAQLDGTIYVERVALFDARQRVKAAKAIKKALKCQADNRGFALVEVLSECPTHLHLTPSEAEAWVRDKMVPVFPLGVKKDAQGAPWTELKRADYSPERLGAVLAGFGDPLERHGGAFPQGFGGHDIALKLAGAGGDGAQTAAMLVTRVAINEGFDATHIPSYGPESRGGTSYADVRIAEDEVLSPAVPEPQVLVAFNAPSLAKFGPLVQRGGVIVYDSGVTPVVPAGIHPSVRVVGVPCTDIAIGLGKAMVKNIVALGALQAATGLFPREAFVTAIRQALKSKCALVPLNEEAFARGAAAVVPTA
jgi:2-oxoisovalerate ferredoxin oxidoreductase beta subunit